jgi:hypothetical protein
VALVTETGQASISMVQRRLRVGYNRAARMIEIMEKEGIVGPADGSRPREVLSRSGMSDSGRVGKASFCGTFPGISTPLFEQMTARSGWMKVYISIILMLLLSFAVQSCFDDFS